MGVLWHDGAVTSTPAAATAAPVNLIVGKEGLLIDRARLSIVQAVRRSAATDSDPDGRNIPLTQLRGGDLTYNELIDLLSPSLFGEDRIVVLTDCQDAGKEPAALIVDSVKEPADGVTIIIQHSGEGRQKKMVADLRKAAPSAAVFEAEALKARDLPGFVQNEFRSRGKRANGDVVDALLDSVGSDLRELSTAIDQLIADTEGKVTVTAVRTYYGATAEVSGFAVAELALTGQTSEAISQTRRAIQIGVPHVLMASAITGMVGDVARLHGVGRVSAKDAKRFGMPPWKLDKTQRLAQRWSTPAVARAMKVAADLDADIKGNARNFDYALEKAVFEISQLASQSHRAGRR